jgi:hypothetical protein
MHQLSGKEFQIGLTMSGAISAGAYTAGVVDFLVEALESGGLCEVRGAMLRLPRCGRHISRIERRHAGR